MNESMRNTYHTYYTSQVLSYIKEPQDIYTKPNLVCANGYQPIEATADINLNNDRVMSVYNKVLSIVDSSYTDATSLTNSLSGVYLAIEIETPTIETTQPYANAQICAEDCYEEFIDTRNYPMPVGHSTEYVEIPEWMENRYFIDLPKLPYQYNTYSTEERVIGTWIDGSYIYERVYKLSSTLTIPSNTWTAVTTISNTNMKSILKATAITSSGTMFDFMGAARDSGNYVKLLSARPSGVEINNVLILQYTKAS